jgi:hypothetical protein
VWRPTTAEKRDWRSRHTATDRRQIASRDVTTGSDRHKVKKFINFFDRVKQALIFVRISAILEDYTLCHKRTFCMLKKKLSKCKFGVTLV